ncbi:MAG: DNA repair protein RecO [Alphaproteobacteria bacterium]|nr:DNA repair protein RecO [Alphaproteobacteria bacterium]
MEWRDQGLLLSTRKHGETAVIVSLLTPDRGRHLGLVRGGQSRRRQGMLQPGNLVEAVWRARLEEHLGSFTLEPVHEFSARVLDDSLRLKAMTAALALLDSGLAEREPHAALFRETLDLLRAMEAAPEVSPGADEAPDWLGVYGRWEVALLACFGFGLDLTACAATGGHDDLVYVSPRSGRAVSREAGAPYRDKLLPLPAFLSDRALTPAWEEALAGLDLTGFFLERHHFGAQGRSLPLARTRFIDALRK